MIRYEWGIQQICNEYSDVLETNHAEKLGELKWALKPAIKRERDDSDKHLELVLLVTWGNANDGIQDDSIALVRPNHFHDYGLPMTFENGKKIPKRFHAELKSWCRKLSI